MGHVSTTEQDNGQLLVEITYGGAEAPFGGIDSSAPPAYIDPKCFAACDGFLVLDDKLVAASFEPAAMPPLFNAVAGVLLLGFGTFFTPLYGQLNYALGVIIAPYAADAGAGMPAGVTYTFYITSWNPSNVALYSTDVLPIALSASFQAGIQASLTLDILTGGGVFNTTATGGTGTVTAVGGGGALINGGFTVTGGTGYQLGQLLIPTQGVASTQIQVTGITSGGALLTAIVVGSGGTGFVAGAFTAISNSFGLSSLTLSFPTLPGAPTLNVGDQPTVGATATALASEISTSPVLNPYVTAAVSADGTQVIITAVSTGTAGNAIEVVDVSRTELGLGGLYPVAFYTSAHNGRYLQGGKPFTTVNPPTTISGKASIVDIGGTLYIGNVGPFILQYSGPGTFTTNTMYNGVNVLRKFNGSLVGLGVNPQINQVYQNQDMIFLWSAATKLSTWAPLNGAGLVTGAGFTQLGDIGDALTGLIVSNNTAFILRQQGITYCTPLQNGIAPYDFAHISLAGRGEGCQLPQLSCQYDMMGVYVGNSNIYGLSNSPSPIGEKVKNAFWAFLATLPDPMPTSLATAYLYFMDSAALAIYAGSTMCPHFAFLLGNVLYIYNGTDGAWMQLGMAFGPPLGASSQAIWMLGVVSNSSLLSTNQAFSQGSLGLLTEVITSGNYSYHLYTLQDALTTNAGYSNPQTVTFPQEEILFGRDVTIDGFYISLFYWTNAPGLTLTFNLNGVAVATLTLPPSAGPLPLVPTLYQVQCANVTAKSPQLTINVSELGILYQGQLQIAKCTMFATIDPKQRPI